MVYGRPLHRRVHLYFAISSRLSFDIILPNIDIHDVAYERRRKRFSQLESRIRRQNPIVKRYSSSPLRKIFYSNFRQQSTILSSCICMYLHGHGICLCSHRRWKDNEMSGSTECGWERGRKDGQKIYGSREKRASLVAMWRGLPFEAFYNTGYLVIERTRAIGRTKLAAERERQRATGGRRGKERKGRQSISLGELSLFLAYCGVDLTQYPGTDSMRLVYSAME